jgi:predicted phage tail protein
LTTRTRDAYTLSVNANRIKDIAAGTYTLRVTATNIFGLSNTASFTFDKETAATVPAFVLDRSFATFMPSKPLRLAAK